jgi:hypothetical protein
MPGSKKVSHRTTAGEEFEEYIEEEEEEEKASSAAPLSREKPKTLVPHNPMPVV